METKFCLGSARQKQDVKEKSPVSTEFEIPRTPFKSLMQEQFSSTLQPSFSDMEYQLPFSLFFTLLLFMFMILRIGKRYRAKNLIENLPPGPKKLPFIGNLHQLLVGSSMPHHNFANLAKQYGPIMHLKLAEVSTILVSSPEAAKEVLHTHGAIFAQRPFRLASSILTYDSAGLAFAPYGQYWRQIKKICVSEMLNAKGVQSFRPTREEEVSSFVNSISSNAGLAVNLSEKIFALTHGITARAVIGRKFKAEEGLIALLKEAVDTASGFTLPELFPSIKVLQMISGARPKIEKIHQKMDRILENILTEHKLMKREVAEDLVDVLLNLQENGNLEFTLTTNNIKAIILEIFMAGSETSSTTVEWAISEMVKNPEILRKAQDEVRQVFDKKGRVNEEGLKELKYLKLIVKETLRLHPSVALLPREGLEKCQVLGYDLPAKTTVIVNVWAIGRDPKYWEEADRFWPERFMGSSIDYKGTDFELIPFGAGWRMCPGLLFGIPNIELPLAELLYYFDWEMPNGERLEDLDMTESFGSTVRRKHDLFLIPIPYHVHSLPVG